MLEDANPDRRSVLKTAATGVGVTTLGSFAVGSATAVNAIGSKRKSRLVGYSYHPTTGEILGDASAKIRGDGEGLVGSLKLGGKTLPVSDLELRSTARHNEKQGVNVGGEGIVDRYKQVWAGKDGDPNRISLSHRQGYNVTGLVAHDDLDQRHSFMLEPVAANQTASDIRESVGKYVEKEFQHDVELSSRQTTEFEGQELTTTGSCSETCVGGRSGATGFAPGTESDGEYFAGVHGFDNVSGFGCEYYQAEYEEGKGNRWHMQGHFTSIPTGYCGGAKENWANYKVISMEGDFEIEFDNQYPKDSQLSDNWAPSFSIGVGVYPGLSVGIGGIELPTRQPYVDPSNNYNYVDWSLDNDTSVTVPNDQEESDGVRVDVIPRVNDLGRIMSIDGESSHEYIVPNCRADGYKSSDTIRWENTFEIV